MDLHQQYQNYTEGLKRFNHSILQLTFKEWVKLRVIPEQIKSPISFEERFMREVYLVANLSKDPRTRIGAVIVKDNDVISTGFNGFCRGVLDLEERYGDRETKYKFICHAEHNSILNAARKGISTLGSRLYTNGISCSECSKAVIQAGIKTIICHKQWPNLTYSENWVKSIELTKIMFEEAGVEIQWFDKELGIKGFLDGKEIGV